MFLDEKYEGNSVSCIVVREAKLPNQAVLSDIAFIVVQKKVRGMESTAQHFLMVSRLQQ